MCRWVKRHASEIVQILVLFLWSAIVISFELFANESLDSAAWLVMGMVGGTVLSEIFYRIREDRIERRRTTSFLVALTQEVQLANSLAQQYVGKSLTQTVPIPLDAARIVFRGEHLIPYELPPLVRDFIRDSELINARMARIHSGDGYNPSDELNSQQQGDIIKFSRSLLITSQPLLDWLTTNSNE